MIMPKLPTEENIRNRMDTFTNDYLITKYPELESLLTESNSIALIDKLNLIKEILSKYDNLDYSNLSNPDNYILKDTAKYRYAKYKSEGNKNVKQ